MSTYGLTDNGFVVKDLQTILKELTADFQSSFGDGIDTDAESVAGNYLGNLSVKFSQMWELLAAIYASFNPDSNTGISLDGSLALIGTERLAASQSSAIVTCYGAEGSAIPANHLVGMENGITWLFESGGEITEGSLSDCQIELVNDPVAGEVFTITINSLSYSYTGITGSTKASVIAGLKAALDAGAVAPVINTALINSDILRIYSFDGKTPFVGSLNALLDYKLIGSPFEYLCNTKGAIAAPSGAIMVITQPVSGVTAVSNLADATKGRDRESDSSARIRRRSALLANSSGTDKAIESQIAEIENVTYAKVYSNRTDSVDSEGRPAHSFELVVLGGDDSEIAEALWGLMASGISTYGSTTITIKDSSGNDQEINFSRTANKYIWISIVATRTTEEDFPENGIAVIKDEIIEWVATGINVGGDVFWQRFFNPVYKCPGIADAEIEIGYSTDPLVPPVSYASENIPVASREVAVFAVDRIFVSVA